MTDEQKRVVESLLATGKAIDDYYGTHGQHGCIEEAAELIEQLSDNLESVTADNVMIRQTSVSHEVYQKMAEDLEEVKQEREYFEKRLNLLRLKSCSNCMYFRLGETCNRDCTEDNGMKGWALRIDRADKGGMQYAT